MCVCILCLCEPLCPFLCSTNYLEMSGVCSVAKKISLVLWIIEMQITPIHLAKPSQKRTLTLALLGYKYLSIIFFTGWIFHYGVCFLFRQIHTYLIDRGTWIHNCFLILRQTPRSRASFFPTFSHMEMGEPDTGGRVIIQPGGEPGSQGESNTCHLFIRAGMKTMLEISICL